LHAEVEKRSQPAATKAASGGGQRALFPRGRSRTSRRRYRL